MKKTVNNWLKGKKKILCITHDNPDGDAVGSVFGLARLLNENNFVADVYLTEELHSIYLNFSEILGYSHKTIINSDVDFDDYDGLILLDSSTEERLTLPNGLKMVAGTRLPTLSIDHHPDNSMFANVNIVKPDYPASTAILQEVFSDFSLSPEVATAFMLGLVRDTGGFKFQNTTEQAFSAAAELMKAGAKYQKVVSEVFFSEPLKKLRLTGEIFNKHLHFYHNCKLVCIPITDRLLEKFNVRHDELEGLIDNLRVIKGIIMICIIRKDGEYMRFSLRSSDERFPVNGIAHKLNGGGHRLAAGAKLKSDSFSTAERRIEHLTKEIFS